MTDQWVTHRLDKSGDGSALGEREWLLANGTGGYAMGTAAGVNTRRYHGLLVGATRPPVGRVVALSQMLERLTLHGSGKTESTIEWATNLFRGDAGQALRVPDGLALLREFRKGLSVAWTWRAAGVTFSRELFLHWREQAVTLRYTVSGLTTPATLHLHPMLTLRDFHAMRHGAADAKLNAEAGEGRMTVRDGALAVTLACPGSTVQLQSDWWLRLWYPRDAERGQEDLEDYFLPGRFDVALKPGGEATVLLTAALGVRPVAPQPTSDRRAAHLAPIVAPLGASDPSGRMLAIASDDFIVERHLHDEKLSTILAGYPWFADWGRDTFIALPGLMLATGRFDEARGTLRVFAEAIRDGLVPNRFDDYDDAAAHYNTVDASLWFIHAALEYVRISGDRAAWDAWLAASVIQVLDAYINGTRYDIAMTGDGLITAGSPQTQLTWMDAACAGTVFTPRHGKAVEINALWYQALLGTAALIAEHDARTADHYERLAGRAKRAFAKVFWDERLDYLRDHVWTDANGVEHADTSLRPNQIFALSLPNSPLPLTKQRRVLDVLRDKLLTPFGLRTLPRDALSYHGRYAGPQFERDKAYHQGTVWPWLIGPYVEAVLRVGQFKPPAVTEARQAIQPLLNFLTGPGLGQLHEIHEAEPPHRPVGCIAQAWSVAEVIRALTLVRQHEAGQ